ncbi:hypothetical protein T492DRAFT_1013787, partial [Pavlovales sp. CCMP2436]
MPMWERSMSGQFRGWERGLVGGFVDAAATPADSAAAATIVEERAASGAGGARTMAAAAVASTLGEGAALGVAAAAAAAATSARAKAATSGKGGAAAIGGEGAIGRAGEGAPGDVAAAAPAAAATGGTWAAVNTTLFTIDLSVWEGAWAGQPGGEGESKARQAGMLHLPPATGKQAAHAALLAVPPPVLERWSGATAEPKPTDSGRPSWGGEWAVVQQTLGERTLAQRTLAQRPMGERTVTLTGLPVSAVPVSGFSVSALPVSGFSVSVRLREMTVSEALVRSMQRKLDRHRTDPTVRIPTVRSPTGEADTAEAAAAPTGALFPAASLNAPGALVDAAAASRQEQNVPDAIAAAAAHGYWTKR